MTGVPSINFHRFIRFCIILGAGLILLVMLNIATGSLSFPWRHLAEIIHPDGESTSRLHRLENPHPRAVAGVLGGLSGRGRTAVAGLFSQSHCRNPTFWASLPETRSWSPWSCDHPRPGLTALTPYITTLAAFVGAYAVMLVVIAISRKVRGGVTLLIIGLMMGYLCYAVTGVLTALAEKEKIKGFVLWQMGSFSGFKWTEIYILLIGGGAILFFIYTLSKPLNAFLLGEEYAASMGVNISRFRHPDPAFLLRPDGNDHLHGRPGAFIGLAVPHMAP
jgi:iron complex transport system permease protein